MGNRITEVVEVREVEGVRFHHAALPGVVLVEPTVHCNERRFFLETQHQRECAAGGLAVTFVQDNHSKSRGGTLRGLHGRIGVVRAPHQPHWTANSGQFVFVALVDGLHRMRRMFCFCSLFLSRNLLAEFAEF